MGASLSTLGGWSIILSIAGWYAYRYYNEGRKREAARIAAHRQRAEDRQNIQGRRENNKGKKLRGEAYTKDLEDSDKSTKPKQRPAKNPATAQVVAEDYSTDDGVDNREFARQLAGVKQGTSFTAPKKTEEKRQRSIKQSRAQEISGNVGEEKISAPSSTTGADADDDQSPAASPEVHAVDAGDVSDMLERPASGPSVLRLVNTGTDKVETKERKPRAPEHEETKKQRQNKRKAEEAKAAREEAERERQVKMEAQRRLARISEGRAAKDGSQFVASKAPAASAWAGKGVNGKTNQGLSDGEFFPVQPLDTFEPARNTDGPKPGLARVREPTDSWMSSLPSEEEQMEMLRKEDDWSTVKQKKTSKGKKKENIGSNEESDSNLVTKPQQVVPVTSEPVVPNTQQTSKPNGRPAKLAQQSSFAALSSTNDGPEEEEEWDV